MKKCSKCKELLSLDNFHKQTASKDGLTGICKSCRKKLCSDYYWNGGKQQTYKHRRTRSKFFKVFTAWIKEKRPCLCGESNYWCLEFHHLDRTKKEYGISAMWKFSIKKVKEELKKCCVICCNCHRKLHANQPLSFNKDELKSLDESVWSDFVFNENHIILQQFSDKNQVKTQKTKIGV